MSSSDVLINITASSTIDSVSLDPDRWILRRDAGVHVFPSGLVAIPTGISIQLSWSSLSWAQAGGYLVYRGTNHGGPYTCIAPPSFWGELY